MPCGNNPSIDFMSSFFSCDFKDFKASTCFIPWSSAAVVVVVFFFAFQILYQKDNM